MSPGRWISGWGGCDLLPYQPEAEEDVARGGWPGVAVGGAADAGRIVPGAAFHDDSHFGGRAAGRLGGDAMLRSRNRRRYEVAFFSMSLRVCRP